jgi:hypothetical protein
MSSLTEVSSTSISKETFTAKVPVFFQPREGLCSKCGVPQLLLLGFQQLSLWKNMLDTLHHA